ncbi:SpaH/EbpB family LPXTG-anchored major pilin [Streptococcus suis]|nr:SpaH/EbpB family LPXTG-anchored major pilin [Streptococcus suis]MBY4989749.1 SpaH/EbpB family LPXTG-anchored major pilin [Streptococcus suis]MCQ9225471.1 SpaH/EbpB family LPXTG-anchored major pilin [Streptococcus suis]MCQ9227745.1 SpaH/EbpB family LPXTG-anchored major pilin [Streptococcus suis]MCQ9241933.1 SpaH/EbpB family LPXTG-anchored major pilin [Streptococcus suis]MCQ9274037.1 SpaH/EbpB family LPXTG-anchored major pilin [Streptococcus suis]
MKKITKLFSVFATLLTVFGTLVNLVPVAHAEMAISKEQPTKVIVHKIVMNKTDFNAFNHDDKQQIHKYDGTQIQTEKFGTYFGQSATEVAGVNFKVWQKVDQPAEGTQTGAQLGITGEGVDENYKLFEFGGDPKYGSEGVNTTESGAEFTLSNGTYIFVEDKAASPYYNKQGDGAGSELTEAKAVPFRLVLPVTLPDGTGYFNTDKPLHVYPKNTEDKPTVTKQFSDNTMGPKDVTIGEEVTYKITTKIPKGSSYKTIVWEDLMVEGLDYKLNSLVIAYKEVESLEKNTHYTVTEDKRGFMVKVNETGLRAIEEAAKTQDVNITLTYNAVLNDSAKVDTEIPNQVTFHYGNRPRTDLYSEPKPVTPKNEGGVVKIQVNKVWKNENDKKAVKFKVYEKATGVFAGEFTLEPNETTKEFSDNLKAGVEYIVVEDTTSGTIPSYTSEGGEKAHIVTVTNNPSDNPPPLTPEKPKVITHGKRFIKTEDKDASTQGIEKLLGAEFVVKNQENKYLALKDAQTQQEQLNRYKQAEEAYQAAVKAKTNEVETKKAERNAAYEALNMQWEWVQDEKQAFKFISSTDGKFEVKGLKVGQYELVETKAPEGYALPSNTIPFNVNQGSWTDTTPQASIEEHMQVKNKKIIIPQTGGIGTLIFTVVGLSTMVFAFIAMKKRQAEEA